MMVLCSAYRGHQHLGLVCLSITCKYRSSCGYDNAVRMPEFLLDDLPDHYSRPLIRTAEEGQGHKRPYTKEHTIQFL